MSRSLAQAVRSQGYAFIEKHMPDAPSLDAISCLGELETVEDLGTLQSLVPRIAANAPPNTYSGNFGTNEFPLHTDLAHWALPPRYLALRCVDGSQTVPTTLLDGCEIIRSFGHDVLRTILVQPRRPMQNGKQLLQLLQKVDDSGLFLLRWDYVYLNPATTYSRGLFEEIGGALSKMECTEHWLLRLGDTLVIDNWRYLHGRGAVLSSAKHRKIERAYLRKLHDHANERAIR